MLLLVNAFLSCLLAVSMDLFWLDLLTLSSSTESPLLLCGVDSVVWMQWLLPGKDNGRSTTKRKRRTMNGVGVVLLRFQSILFLFVCFPVVGCLRCCHRGEPVLIFLRFSTDSSPPYNLCGASQIMGSEPCVSTTRTKISGLAECPPCCIVCIVRSVFRVQRLAYRQFG